MSTSLDNIWDEPLLNSPPRTPVRQKTPSALFLDGPDEEHNNPNDVLREPMDIDKLFEGLDDDDGDSNTKTKDKTSSQPFDINAYRRKAQERAAKEVASDPVFSKYAVQSSSPPRDLGDENSGNKKDGKKDKDGDEPKQRKKVMRLDENRLLSKDGFPALIRQVKEFKPRGKGHEVADLNRLMNIYQYWAHSLNPKIQFSDTAQRVERLCRTKRMAVSLQVWQDEFHGTINGVPRDHGSENGSDSEADGVAQNNADSQRTSGEPNGTSRAPSSDPFESENNRVSRPPSSLADPLTDADDNLFDDIDLDAIFDEPQVENGAGAIASGRTLPNLTVNPSSLEDEDVDMWAEYEAMGVDANIGTKATKPSERMDEDEDAWAALREAEDEEDRSGLKSATTKPVEAPSDQPVHTDNSEKSGATVGVNSTALVHDDLDDMYV